MVEMIQDEWWRICSCLGEVLEQRRRWLYVICNIISGWWNFSVFLKSMFQFIKVLALIVASKPISLIWSTASWQQSFFQRVLFTPNLYQEHTFVPNLKHLVHTQLLVAVLKDCLIWVLPPQMNPNRLVYCWVWHHLVSFCEVSLQ